MDPVGIVVADAVEVNPPVEEQEEEEEDDEEEEDEDDEEEEEEPEGVFDGGVAEVHEQGKQRRSATEADIVSLCKNLVECNLAFASSHCYCRFRCRRRLCFSVAAKPLNTIRTIPSLNLALLCRLVSIKQQRYLLYLIAI